MRNRIRRTATGLAAVAAGLVVVMAAQSAAIVQAATTTQADAASDWPTFQIGNFTAKDHNNNTIHGGEGTALQINVYGFHFGVVAPRDPSTGQATGKRKYSTLEVTRPIDYSTPRLLQALANNEDLKTVTINVYAPATTTPYLKYVLTDARVAQITHDGEGLAETVPLEQDFFYFPRICVEYTPQAGQGAARVPSPIQFCDNLLAP